MINYNNNSIAKVMYNNSEIAKVLYCSNNITSTIYSKNAELTFWQDFQAKVRNNTIQNYYAVNDIISVQHDIFGTINFQIVAFNNAILNNANLNYSVTLLSEKSICEKYFDASEPLNTITDRRTYGNSTWDLSNIRQWLNSDGAANSWYSQSYAYDASPTYATEDGFLKGLDSDFKGVLADVKNETILSDTDGGGVVESIDKVFLPSYTEIKGGTGEGTKYQKYVLVTSNAETIKYDLNGVAINWALRTLLTTSARSIRYITTTGVYWQYSAANSLKAIVPACVIA